MMSLQSTNAIDCEGVSLFLKLVVQNVAVMYTWKYILI